MAVKKRGKWYWMHDFVNGVEYRRALKTRNYWQEARKLHQEKLNAPRSTDNDGRLERCT